MNLSKMFYGLSRPKIAFRYLGSYVPFIPLEVRQIFDFSQKPSYTYGLWKASQLAAKLGYHEISAIEFGVAGGRGLLELEWLAMQMPTDIKLYGFDLGEGLPEPSDYRDLPYIWQKGFYKMDSEKLKSKLKNAELVLGNVKDTVPKFKPSAPIGFVSFDLDFYSSTKDALKIFDFCDLLPRVYCYFDDIIGPEEELHNRYVGELLAIDEFNECHENLKLATINGLKHKRIIPAAWNDQIFVLHCFDHPRYGEYVRGEADCQLQI